MSQSKSNAETGDIMERLADVIYGWGKLLPPGFLVLVRADLITAAYAEIEKLREEKTK